LAAISCALAAA
jgi:hypothetical protein